MENEKVFAMSFSKVYGLEAVFTDDNKTGRGRGTKETGGRKEMRKWISRILFVVSIIHYPALHQPLFSDGNVSGRSKKRNRIRHYSTNS